MRKPAFCICKNKDADQLRSNCAADQRLCFHYMDSTIPLLPLWPVFRGPVILKTFFYDFYTLSYSTSVYVPLMHFL